MFKLRNITLIILILVCIFNLYAHNPIINTFDHNPFTRFLKATPTEITCNISNGTIFTKQSYYRADGTYIKSVWVPKLINPASVTISGVAHGHGFAQIIGFHGDIDGSTFGDLRNKSEPIDVGWHVPGLPWALYAHDVEITQTHYKLWNTKKGKHSWNGSGSIEYTPWYYDLRIGFSGDNTTGSGVWKEGTTSSSGMPNDGYWNVKYKSVTIGSGSNDKDNDEGEEENSEGSEEQGNATPTVPDRPGSFELSPRKTAILLTWTDADDGGSPITDYQYQIQYSRTHNRTRWTSWSDWSSAGTGNSTWINGLYKNVNYAVRMRAVNAVGPSSVTGIKIVKTNK